MGNQPTVSRTFMVKAGMTPQDVINSKEATAQQKKMAYVFDSDGVAGYSQREADVFNATLITDRGQNGVSLWTRYKDGSKKETRYVGDITNFKYAPKGEVKPYVVAKKQAPNAPKIDQTKSLATQIVQEFEQTGKGELNVETYDSGKLKSRVYINQNGNKEVTQLYYENGTLQEERVNIKPNGHYRRWFVPEKRTYYPNGKLQSENTKASLDTKSDQTIKNYYEDGTLKDVTIKVCPNGHQSNWFEREKRTYYPNGKLQSSRIRKSSDPHSDDIKQNYYENGKLKDRTVMVCPEGSQSNWFKKEEVTYYSNGNPKYSMVRGSSDPKSSITTINYYENGQAKDKTIEEYKDDKRVVTTHIGYDSNGNVIKNAKVTK